MIIWCFMHELFQRLDSRRRDLAMSYAALARLSGVSIATVTRILSGKHPSPAFNNVWAIADALGMTLKATPRVDAITYSRQAAKRKATTIVGMVQGTAGLECQAVGKRALERMREQTLHELMAGSRRKLW